MNDKKTLGETIFVDIESNAYLNELHENILFNYALKLFQIQGGQREYNLKDALRFADLLSKSTHPTNSDSHKMWAQELIILLNELHPEDALVKLYAGSVFSSAGNYQGLQIINSEYQDINVFEKIFEQFRNDYLTIPAAPEMKFFSAQKEAYDHLTDPCFSYSGPTSMGKSFIMRMFIKDEILHGAKKNYALIVPTKALINEVRSKIINDLEDNLKRCNYRVVTAASDIALEENHNFIFVLTPERLLYLLISNNLYGNVFFVSDEKSVSSESYIEMLQEPIPEQELSIESNPQALKRVEKKYIAEILKSGSSEIPKRREDQSEESYVMMRKFGLILLRDIMEERDSLVHREFSDFLTVEDEQQIREKFNSSPTLPDDDINTSVDQTKRLIIAIKNGLEYPSSKNGFKYDDIIDFFNKLSKIFDWPIYEKSTLGNESKRKWYAVILSQWMEGSGLSYIMQRAIDYHKQHPENFWVSAYQPPTIYNDNSKEHRNVVFADTLEAIENIVLFSISNYFLRFSNEYKKIHGVDEFDNNWYEYVEFGTTNPLTILLQRNGFSRESATFIKKHKDEYVAHDGSTDELRLRLSLLDCGNTSVMTEAASIRFNAPKLFLEEDA